MKRSTFFVRKGGKMDIGQFCSELLKNEIDSYVIPTNQASFYLAAGAKAFAKNAPDVLSAIGATPFNALAATALFFKIANIIGDPVLRAQRGKELGAMEFRFACWERNMAQ